jgi:lipoprotein-anchoring transpeptidase ErfK/SrfK
VTDYVIAEDDVDGPFVDRIPEDYAAMATMERLPYTSPLEALAEKFHMDRDLLRALNPDADFSKAGTTILVAAPGPESLPTQVALVEVDKARKQVRAYSADNRLVAAYPPSGQWAVRAVAKDPPWNYDPSRLNFGDRSAGKLTIPPGPNNPVGVVWIDLTKDTYGIHGAPEPSLVGKTASHGCVRLTNWDARSLASAVRQGTKVVFVGSERPEATPS